MEIQQTFSLFVSWFGFPTPNARLPKILALRFLFWMRLVTESMTKYLFVSAQLWHYTPSPPSCAPLMSVVVLIVGCWLPDVLCFPVTFRITISHFNGIEYTGTFRASVNETQT